MPPPFPRDLTASVPPRRALLRTALVGAAATAGASAVVGPARGQGGGPVATVEALHAALLGVMREAASLGVRGRAERLRPALEAALDLPAMARGAAGAARWNAASEAEREALASAFAGWTTAVYASRFTGYSGERFETLGEEAAPGGGDGDARLVRTRLVRGDPSQPPVPLNYLLRRSPDGRWRAVDIYLQGTVSEIATRRAEFASTLREGGAGRLAAVLRERAAGLLAGGAT